jgi:hypothetical protein
LQYELRGSEQLQYRPQESLDVSVERFLASLRFEQRGKREQISLDVDTINLMTR